MLKYAMRRKILNTIDSSFKRNKDMLIQNISETVGKFYSEQIKSTIIENKDKILLYCLNNGWTENEFRLNQWTNYNSSGRMYLGAKKLRDGRSIACKVV